MCVLVFNGFNHIFLARQKLKELTVSLPSPQTKLADVGKVGVACKGLFQNYFHN